MLKRNEHSRQKTNRPLRLALLGDIKVGKSSFIQNVVTKNFVETYYPTYKATPTLLEWAPSTDIARAILNEYSSLKDVFPILDNDKIVIAEKILSAVNTSSINSNSNNAKAVHRSSSSKTSKKMRRNPFYDIVFNEESTENVIISDPNAQPFEISPILLELIDTAPFNPKQIVPFLEASLDVKLPPDILHNLANEPRRDHSAKPLIVASGASDLNGNVDGYFFVYTAIPSLNPPGYNDDESQDIPTALDQLREMKLILSDAWKEYSSYKKGWELGGEGDVFSFVYNVKSLWKKQSALNAQSKVAEDCLPPILIVCTHSNSELRSPKLIEDGKKLAKEWSCGFIAIDNLNSNDVDIATGLLIRDVVEASYTTK